MWRRTLHGPLGRADYMWLDQLPNFSRWLCFDRPRPDKRRCFGAGGTVGDDFGGQRDDRWVVGVYYGAGNEEGSEVVVAHRACERIASGGVVVDFVSGC